MSEEVKVVDAQGEQPPVDSGAEPTAPPEPETDRAAGLLTNEQVDRIIKSRIDKQNEKHAKELEELVSRIGELEETAKSATAEAEALRHEKEVTDMRGAVASETGVPVEVLRGETLDELKAHAQQILSSMPVYPVVASDTGATAEVALSKEAILAISDDKERRKAINENIELFHT